MDSIPYVLTIRDRDDSSARKVLDGFLNLIYPERCFLCSIAVSRHHECGVCDGCWGKAVALKIVPPRCASCGLPLHNFQESSDYLCGDCIRQMPPYSGARSFGYYHAELRLLVQGLKFQNRRNLVKLLAPLLACAFHDSWRKEDFDLIVPMPLHRKRKLDRGYNQSDLLARSLARQVGIRCSRALTRTRATLPQVGLTDAQRMENVRKAFRCADPRQISGRRILLIDDVMTTGATAASASGALLAGGARRISVLTVARTERR
jgi:ComF family protein